VRIHPELEKLGVRLVAVGNGSKMFARKFQEAVPFDGEIYLDPESKTHKAANCPRWNIWSVLKRFMLDLKQIVFFRSLSDRFPEADLKGDGQQSGGVFVLGPGKDSKILYEFREAEATADSFADLQKIYEVCGGEGELKIAESSKEEKEEDGKKKKKEKKEEESKEEKKEEEKKEKESKEEKKEEESKEENKEEKKEKKEEESKEEKKEKESKEDEEREMLAEEAAKIELD